MPPVPASCPLPAPGIGIIGLEASYILPIFLRLTVARKWFKKVRAGGMQVAGQAGASG